MMMDIEVCVNCKYHSFNGLHWCHKHKDEYIAILCRDIRACSSFTHRYTFDWSADSININYTEKDGDKMNNDSFATCLRSTNRHDSILSRVEIKCDRYETFKKIVDAVMPILEKEDEKRECD